MRRRFIPTTLMLTALCACKVGIASQVFTSDALAALEAGSSVAAVTVLDIESGSEDKCNEHSAAIGEALKQGFADVTFLECTRVDATSMARYRVSVPMGVRGSVDGSALGIEVSDLGDRIGAVMRRNPAKIDQIVAALPDDVRTFAKQTYEPQITVTLQNDLPGDAAVIMQGAFVDGQPYQLDETFPIARRGELHITLSSVGNAVLMSENASNGSLLFFMAKPK